MKKITFAVLSVLIIGIFLRTETFAQVRPVPPNILWQHIGLPNEIYYQGLAWSPDSESIAILDIRSTSISILDLDTLQLKEQFSLPASTHETSFPSIEWSPDGKFFALVYDRTLYLLDAKTGAIQYRYTALENRSSVNEVRWSSDARKIAVLIQNREEGEIRILNVPTGDEVQVIALSVNEDHAGNLIFDWSPDGRWFVRNEYWFDVGGLNGSLIALDSEERQFSNATSEEQVSVENQCAGGWVIQDSHPVVEWSSDSRRVLFAGSYGLAVCVLVENNLTEESSVQYVSPGINGAPIPVFPATWSPDGHWIIATSSSAGDEESDCRSRLYDPNEDLHLTDIYDGVCIRFALTWSPNGQFIAGIDSDGIWLGTVER